MSPGELFADDRSSASEQERAREDELHSRQMARAIGLCPPCWRGTGSPTSTERCLGASSRKRWYTAVRA